MAAFRAERRRRPRRRAAAGRRWCAAPVRSSAARAAARPRWRRAAADQSSAAAPVTNGVAALVPDQVITPSGGARLVMRSPGADRPRRPMPRPKLEYVDGVPAVVHAATGTTHGWRVSAEPPTTPSLPAATTTSVPRRAARSSALVRAGRAGGGGRRQRGADVQDLRARLDAVLDGGRQRAGRRAHVALRVVGEHRPRQQRAARTDRRRRLTAAADEDAGDERAVAGGGRRGRRAGRAGGHQPDAPAVEAGMVDRNRPVDQADDHFGPAAGQHHQAIEADLPERIRDASALRCDAHASK